MALVTAQLSKLFAPEQRPLPPNSELSPAMQAYFKKLDDYLRRLQALAAQAFELINIDIENASGFLQVLDVTITVTQNTTQTFIDGTRDWRGNIVFWTMFDPRTDINTPGSGILWDPNTANLSNFLVESNFNAGGDGGVPPVDYQIDSMSIDFTPCTITLNIEDGTGKLYVVVTGHTGNHATDDGLVRILAFVVDTSTQQTTLTV